jgi:HEPN domain-containing protein
MPAEPSKWLTFAEEDLAAARRLIGDQELPPRLACFHAQQAAEKALKAALVAADTPFPRTHDLLALFALVSYELRSDLDEVDLSQLEPWVVDARYPSDIPEVDPVAARTIIDVAATAVQIIRSTLLGIEPK